MNRIAKTTTQVAATVLAWGFVFAAAQPSFAQEQAVETWVTKQEQALVQKLSNRLGLPSLQVSVPVRHPRIRVRLVAVSNATSAPR
jgi:hypothetical protein